MNKATGDLEQLECLYTGEIGFPGQTGALRYSRHTEELGYP